MRRFSSLSAMMLYFRRIAARNAFTRLCQACSTLPLTVASPLCIVVERCLELRVHPRQSFFLGPQLGLPLLSLPVLVVPCPLADPALPPGILRSECRGVLRCS